MGLIEFIIWLSNEIQTMYHIVCSPIRGKTHQERLESFYSHQANNYDSYRKRLLACREMLLDQLPTGGIWVDMGGGTGYNIEYMAKSGKLKNFTKIYLVDLSLSLLKIARKRIENNQWTNIEIIEADATHWRPKEEQIDLVTFSYSLTMIPNWFTAIENAKQMLKINGCIGITDFYYFRKYPSHGLKIHSWFRRTFWSIFFALDNVNLSSDHLPYLIEHFQVDRISETLHSIPYIPFFHAPQYFFIGHLSKS